MATYTRVRNSFVVVVAVALGLVVAGTPAQAAGVSSGVAGAGVATTNVTVFGPRTSPTVKYGVLDCDAATALGCGRFVHA